MAMSPPISEIGRYSSGTSYFWTIGTSHIIKGDTNIHKLLEKNMVLLPFRIDPLG
jgi:hypothetical protein